MMTGTVARYSGGAILLHWLIAFLLAGELALGFVMPRDASGFELFQLHKSIGITILLLSLLRLGWRLTHKRPAKIEGGINGVLASAVHIGFYVVMIVVPLSGWAIVSTSDLDIPTLLFGVVPWPHLPLAEGLNGLFEETHEILAKVGIGLFALHVVGALRHHVLMKDALLSRMGPGGSGAAVLGLLAAVVALGALVFFTVGNGASDHDHDDHAHEEAAEPAVLLPAGTEDDAGLGVAPDAAGEAAGDEEDMGEEANAADDDAAAPDAPEEAAPAVAAQPVTAVGPPPSWTIQPGGTLKFAIANDGATINGAFSRWSGTIAMDPQNPQSAQIAINIQLASASVNDATRDAMLVGGDFLAATANPTAIWRATSVRRLGGNRYEADGTLTLKGASKPQRIVFTLEGSGARRSVRGSATIARSAFAVGVGPNASTLGPDVSVTFAFEASL